MARTRASDFPEKQRAILDGAAAVFAREGMEKASMASIAREAGISKSLLYHYYPGKEALIFAIIMTHLEELDAAIEAADTPQADAEIRLRRIVRAILANYRGADDRHKVQINAAGALEAERRAAIAAMERRIVHRLGSVLAAINPVLATDGAHLLKPATMSLFGMLNWLYMWFREDGPISREQYADLAATLMTGGLRSLGTDSRLH